MTWIFWGSVLLVGYAYVGYPLVLFLRGRLFGKPVKCAPFTPTVSVIIAAHNESAVLPRKFKNLAEIEYPADLMEIVVASDGSTDATNDILRQHETDRVRPIICPEHGGKALALNRAVAIASGEILIFTDARQKIEASAFRRIVENFADPEVGCVSGELMIGEPGPEHAGKGAGLYWRLEKKIRQMESACGSVVGATGAIYAIRKSLSVEIPAGTILDDVFVPMYVARQGKRVIFESSAHAWDDAVTNPAVEFRRKVRTLNGNYQLVQLAPWLLTRRNPLLFAFISHKLLRLVVPFLLIAILVSSLLLASPIYRLAAAGQLVFYAVAALRALHLRLGVIGKVAEVAFTFVLFNAAAVIALVHFLTGRKAVWVR